MSDKNITKEQFDDGMSEFLNGNYESSIQYFTRAIDVDADFTLALKSRGAAYLKSNRVPEAIADFDRLIQLDPENARAYHLRGLAHEKAGEFEKALGDFNYSI
jgi:tetratricopeptide (TPR) repeat protein